VAGTHCATCDAPLREERHGVYQNPPPRAEARGAVLFYLCSRCHALPGRDPQRAASLRGRLAADIEPGDRLLLWPELAGHDAVRAALDAWAAEESPPPADGSGFDVAGWFRRTFAGEACVFCGTAVPQDAARHAVLEVVAAATVVSSAQGVPLVAFACQRCHDHVWRLREAEGVAHRLASEYMLPEGVRVEVAPGLTGIGPNYLSWSDLTDAERGAWLRHRVGKRAWLRRGWNRQDRKRPDQAAVVAEQTARLLTFLTDRHQGPFHLVRGPTEWSARIGQAVLRAGGHALMWGVTTTDIDGEPDADLVALVTFDVQGQGYPPESDKDLATAAEWAVRAPPGVVCRDPSWGAALAALTGGSPLDRVGGKKGKAAAS
jgi:hypothetical protein